MKLVVISKAAAASLSSGRSILNMAAVELIEGNKESPYSSLQSGHKVRDFVASY